MTQIIVCYYPLTGEKVLFDGYCILEDLVFIELGSWVPKRTGIIIFVTFLP